ncbi:MAG TPA: AAA family ATPase [Acidimicrobiales bacterium]|jgi:DNA-binding CsgD family transcriptional regulator|nr:AAA family ATPase [Acidimicrobiales bacterium]
MLLDRIAERAALEGVLDSARRGISGALVLRGEPGMGKTLLLDHAAASAQDLRLVRISGIEAESTFGFGALHRCLLPFLGSLNDLPPPQRDALSSAFGLSTRAPADLFLVGLATLTLLADAAATEGLLCIVDDAQWVDQESLQVLAFVGRRLSADGIALIFGIRASEDVLPLLAGLPTTEIGGLPESAALELLYQVAPDPLDVQVAQRIVTETSGCPLALTELAHELTSMQWAGASRVPEPIPITRRLETHFRRQVDTMPADAQTFALVAAAETSGDPSLVRMVSAQLGCSPDAEALVVQERLLSTDPRIEFRHPLIRSAVYAGASAEERRVVHGALAASIDRSADPDRWAGHIVATARGPDDELAAELEKTARRARDRGGYAAEATLLAQAAELTGDLPTQSARLLHAAEAALMAGEAHRANALLAQARPGLTEPHLRAEAQQLAAALSVPLGQPAAAAALLLDAARQFLPLDIDRARESLLEALDAFMVSQHFTLNTSGAEIAEAALATAGRTERRQLADYLLDGTSLLLATGYGEATRVLGAAFDIMRNGPVSPEDLIRWSAFGMAITNEICDDHAYAQWVQLVESSAREQGALIALQVALVGLAGHEIRAGQFSAAETHLAEALEITAAVGGAIGFYRPLNVTLLAWRGDATGTRSAARQLIKRGTLVGSAPAVFQAHYALAILELGAGRYSDALSAARGITDHQALGFSGRTLPLVVEAGVRSGDRTAAEHALDEMTARVRAIDTGWARGLLARSQALLAGDDDAEALFEQSISYLKQTSVVTDLARAHLLYGEWLRRQNRRVDARRYLRLAYESFAAMGAGGFAERARAELLATGERARRRSVDTGNDLTAQELQISRLASRGATNPEIAAKLFVSSSTIDYHLKKVFRKLDITSRRQLEQHLPE